MLSTISQTSRSKHYFILVFLSCLAFLTFFVDKTGYEGDDLNSVLPMLHLNEAREGLLKIYRYDWQPLSYEIGAALIDITGSPISVFLLPPLSIALALALLYSLLAQRYSIPPFIFVCLILLSPEILFTGLYYNSVALGYVAAMGALVLTFREPNVAKAFAIGGALGLALLLRLDFVLIIPAMLLLLWFRTSSLRLLIVAGATAGAIILIAMGSGFMQLSELLRIYQFHSAEIVAKSNSGGWNDHTKMFVASTILSPLGFAYYGLGALWLLQILPRRESMQGLAIAVALSPALMSIPDILSVKYMLPSFVFLPLLGAKIWFEAQRRPDARGKWVNRGMITGTVFLCFAAIDIDNEKPYVRIAVWETRQIRSHDGARSWGAYIGQIARVERLGGPERFEALGQKIANSVLSTPNETVVFIGPDTAFGPGSIGWRHAALSLAYDGFHGAIEGAGVKSFSTPTGAFWLSVSTERVPKSVLTDPDTILIHADEPNLPAKIAELSSRIDGSE